MLVDEVIQSGIYFITKSQVCYNLLLNYLWEYLSQYNFLKSSDRVMLISGSAEGISVKPLGIATKASTEKKGTEKADIDKAGTENS